MIWCSTMGRREHSVPSHPSIDHRHLMHVKKEQTDTNISGSQLGLGRGTEEV